MPLWKFQDLMATEELYFRRADKLEDQDPEEGLAPEEYLRLLKGLKGYDIQDEKEVDADLGFLAQIRQCYYIQCWYLHGEETLRMWQDFAAEGVAVRSRFDLLWTALDKFLDSCDLSLIHYGEEHLRQRMGFNVLELINTKRLKFHEEREVRAMLNIEHPFLETNRNYGENNWPSRLPKPENPTRPWIHEYKRRRIDLKSLITGITLSPWATEALETEVKEWVKIKNFDIPVESSSIKSTQLAIPTAEELKKYKEPNPTNIPGYPAQWLDDETLGGQSRTRERLAQEAQNFEADVNILRSYPVAPTSGKIEDLLKEQLRISKPVAPKEKPGRPTEELTNFVQEYLRTRPNASQDLQSVQGRRALLILISSAADKKFGVLNPVESKRREGNLRRRLNRIASKATPDGNPVKPAR